ncbi:hypothetical protein [Roseovarius pelagicus]|uniref:hypothetical protein n=1 Tax=Roseovarius pelagicus TaxID=2980108 RepID=UPI0021D69D71|nr:hypothetical protein [Roseovarius pelagicus]
MSQSMSIETAATVPHGSPRMLLLIAALLVGLAVALVSTGGGDATVSQGSDSQQIETAPAEDWHGNVKRSHWSR